MSEWAIFEQFHWQESMPQIVNQQRVVYRFQCDLCDAGYVGYIRDTDTCTCGWISTELIFYA